MTRAAVSEVHDRVFIADINARGIKAVVEIIRHGSAVAEVELFFRSVRKKLIEPIVGVVDDQRRRTREMLMRPCVGENVHRDARRLSAFALCQLDGAFHQLAVWPADQPVFVAIALRAALRRHGVQILRKEVERRPDTGDILQTADIGSRAHQLKLQLRRRRGTGRFQLIEQRHAAKIDKLVAVGDLLRFLVRIAGKDRGAIRRVIVEIRIHAVASFLLNLRIPIALIISSSRMIVEVRSMMKVMIKVKSASYAIQI